MLTFLGRMHLISMVTCPCESDAVTFMRHGLWGSTVKHPRVAVHMSLMNDIEFFYIGRVYVAVCSVPIYKMEE